MSVRVMRQDELEQVAEMMRALWPDAGAYNFADEVVFVWQRPQGGLGGFCSVSVREWAEGCEQEPVAYVEGWWVAPDLRAQGVGRQLMKAAEVWAREQGYREIGSDTESSNDASQRAHLALGFEERTRIVFFRKLL
jgi:aminoglycoside 6'-N-acetyltransferase I